MRPRITPESHDEDEQLVRLAQEGDATAYRGIVEKYQDRVNTLVYGLLRNREDARDVTQETFVRAYQALGALRREGSPFRPWLIRIATNAALDVLRRRNRHPTVPYGADRYGGSDDPRLLNLDDPHHLYARKELYGRILDALDTLSEEQRQALLLRELEGLDYGEIGAILGIAPGTVMSRIFYARKNVQKILDDEETLQENESVDE